MGSRNSERRQRATSCDVTVRQSNKCECGMRCSPISLLLAPRCFAFSAPCIWVVVLQESPLAEFGPSHEHFPCRSQRVGRGKNMVGPVRPEPACLGNEGATPVANISDVVGGQAANDAAFIEAGNRHRSLLGGR